MKAVVIGAGPAGLTAAHQLSKQTPDVTVLEAADCVGGLARSIELWGQRVDLGPHRFFSQDRRVNELWLEVVGRDYFMVNRQTRILYQDKLFRYPLEAFGALAKLGPVEAARCLGSYAKEFTVAQISNLLYRRVPFGRMHGKPPDSERLTPGGLKTRDTAGCNPAPQSQSGGSFEDWVCARFGRRLLNILQDLARNFGHSLQRTGRGFRRATYQEVFTVRGGQERFNFRTRKQHRTLADEFAYPVSGTGMVYERMAKAIQQRGGEVRLNVPVRKVLTESTLTLALSHPKGEGGVTDARPYEGRASSPLHAASQDERRRAQVTRPTSAKL